MIRRWRRSSDALNGLFGTPRMNEKPRVARIAELRLVRKRFRVASTIAMWKATSASTTRAGSRCTAAMSAKATAMALRASVPVGDTSGHQGGMITIRLPVGAADPGDRLRLIVAETSQRKRSPHGGVAGIVAMPAGLARLGVLWARRTATAHINLYVTNVPGPSCPLYLAGARMHDVVPLAPLVAGVRLSVTALSYDGALSVALLADEAVTGFPGMAAGVRSGFATYLSRAGEFVPRTG